MRGGADDADFGERRRAAAQAVELAAVAVGRAERAEEDGRPERARGGEVGLAEEKGARGAAAVLGGFEAVLLAAAAAEGAGGGVEVTEGGEGAGGWRFEG